MIAEVAFVIQVHTLGKGVTIKDVDTEELRDNQELLDNVVASIEQSEEVEHALQCINAAANIHFDKYPDTEMYFCKALNVYKPTKIEWNEDGWS